MLKFPATVVWCVLAAPIPNFAWQSSHGSLAVFVPTREGLAVCADKREWNRVRGPDDSVRKIRAMRSNLAFLATGTVASLNPNTLKPEFSVYQTVSNHFTVRGSVEERLATLPQVLESAYRRYKTNTGRRLELSPDAQDDVLFSLLVWYSTPRRVHVEQLQFHNATANGENGVSRRDLTAEIGQSFYIEGQTTFILQAIRNSDPRFMSVKADSDIRSVWTSKSPDAISLAMGVRFGRKVIAATSKFHALVSQGTPALVSADADCSVMRPARGFEWIIP